MANSNAPKAIGSPDAQQREVDDLREQVTSLTQQLDWFKRQVFGEKSEKRFIDPQIQPDLLAADTDSAPDADVAEATGSTDATPVRVRRKKRSPDDVNEHGLRFDDSVPRTVIKIVPGEWVDGKFEVIGEKVTHRLCQRPGSVELIEYR